MCHDGQTDPAVTDHDHPNDEPNGARICMLNAIRIIHAVLITNSAHTCAQQLAIILSKYGH